MASGKEFAAPANSKMATIAGLSPGKTYEVFVNAYNEFGHSRSAVVQVTLPETPRQEPYTAWIDVLDWSTSDSSGTGTGARFPPSISAPPASLPHRYEATAAVAYYDANRNGLVDMQPTSAGAQPAFPYYKAPMMPTTEVPQAWSLRDTNLVDSLDGQAANFVVYAELPATHGAEAASQHVTLHLRYDGTQVSLLSASAGDLYNPLGHLMGAPSVRPALPSFQIALPNQGRPGRLSGAVELELLDLEYFSYLLPSGTPALGRLDQRTSVVFHFELPVLPR